MVVTSRMWDTLCATIDRPELLLDPRFEDMWKRNENGDELYAEISKWTKTRTKWEVMEILGEAGVPCSAVLDTYDLFHNPTLRGARLRPRPRPSRPWARSVCSAGRRGCPRATCRSSEPRCWENTPARCSATTSA